MVLWGSPSPEALEELATLMRLELEPPTEPHASLFDARRVTDIGSASFTVLVDYVRRHRAALAKYLSRLALVRPDGYAGALAAGFHEVAEAPYAVRVFAHPEPGLKWIGVMPAGLSAQLDEIVAAAQGVAPLLSRVRRSPAPHGSPQEPQ